MSGGDDVLKSSAQQLQLIRDRLMSMSLTAFQQQQLQLQTATNCDTNEAEQLVVADDDAAAGNDSTKKWQIITRYKSNSPFARSLDADSLPRFGELSKRSFKVSQTKVPFQLVNVKSTQGEYFEKKKEAMKADLIEKFRRAATQTEDKAHNLVRLRDNPNQLGSFSVDQFPEYESERVSIKISNIPPQTSSDNLKHLLDQQRVDHEGIIFGKYNQNQNKDYCFVKIMDKPHAEAAIRVLDGILFNDFVLRVEIARPPKRRD